MKTIFRKVRSKERFPKKDGEYIALRSGYNMGNWTLKNGEWTHEHNEGVKYELEWWLEEIELPSLKQIEPVITDILDFADSKTDVSRKILMWIENGFPI